MNPYSHLHCHTQFSLLDGAARIEDMIQKAADHEMPGVAITDHGNMFGVPHFVNEAQKRGVKPIVGCEFYITPSGMKDREDRTRYHQVLLAKNMMGYRNLVKLCSLGYVDGLYYKPRIDKKTLEEYSEGLIATTCCIASEINQTIIKKGEDEAKKIFEWYLNLFGEDYYIELQRHGLKDQNTCNEVLIRWSKEYGVKMIATNDSHYTNKEDSEAHDILLALQTNADLNDPNRFRFTDDYNNLNPEFYLKTPEEMQELFRDVPEAIDNTIEIVEKTEILQLNSDLLLPTFRVPPEYKSNDDYLRYLTYEGAKKRYGELTGEVSQRIEHELKIIEQMGFAGYFLIVQGFTSEARKRGVFVGPGRGSAAGSVVAYCIGIINIDPMKYDLLFERFLNPERVSPPDIDIDFDDVGRQAVIDYVVEEYGRQNVSQIVTYGTMKAKTAIRDVGRVLGVPLAEVNRISKLFPDRPGVDTFAKVLDPEKNPDTHQDIKQLFEDPEPQIRRMMKFARTLEGSARQTGIHAAGVIIAPGKVYDYVPVALSKEKDVITQYDGPSAEKCGLLKMDFLGLKTLSILKTAMQYIKENYGKEYTIDTIPLEDEKTFELYQRGETVGTFQFESDGMRKHLKDLNPTSIDDLIAMNALYRPGPMQFIQTYIERKKGNEKVEYPHPSLEKVLKSTYGIMVYQEQIMQVAQIMAGYTLGEADLLRRAMGKKKVEVMEKQREIFISRAVERDVDKETAVDVFEKMAYFAGYGFNKSHAAAYSVVAYQTGYFKANYPAEYMASVLTHNMNDIKKVSSFIEECQRMGIAVDPPNVNTGAGNFVVREGRIQYGMVAIKGVGSHAVEQLVEEREKNGTFSSIFDFTGRVDLRSCNRKTIESLITAGAFDSIHSNRAQLMESLDDALQYGQRKQQDDQLNQISLFEAGGNGSVIPEPSLREAQPWTNIERLKKERELIGFYLSGHPLDKFKDDISLFCSHQLLAEKLEELDDRTPIACAGIITSVKRVTDRKGRPFAFLTIEDEVGSVEVIAFSNTFDKFMNLLVTDNIVVIDGVTDSRSGTVKIIANAFDRIENLREKNADKIRLHINLRTESLVKEDYNAISELFSAHRGNTPVALDVFSPHANKPLRMNVRKYVIDPSEDMLSDLRKVIGRDNVNLERV
ncbi:MAG TPA: DNA polymerase III subunit alpha [Balneolales bacterium]|nr:DNA polymerase III subunit alpha [Balneolales bacterium]